MTAAGISARDPALATGMEIDIWSDVVCPWCYIGEERLRKALAAEGLEDARITVHSFELAPDASDEKQTKAEYFLTRKGMDAAQMQQMEARIGQLAEGEGLAYVSDVPMAKTVDAHRITQAARAHGKAEEFFTAVQRGYFRGEVDPFEHEDLLRVAREVGLDEQVARDALTSDDALQAVRTDQMIAQQIGVQGVPFILLNRRLAIPGAVEVDQFRQALRQADELGPPTEEELAAAAEGQQP